MFSVGDVDSDRLLPTPQAWTPRHPRCTVEVPRLSARNERDQKFHRYFQSLAVENRNLRERNAHLERTIICAEMRFGEFASKLLEPSKSSDQPASMSQREEQQTPSAQRKVSGQSASRPARPAAAAGTCAIPELVCREKQTQVSPCLLEDSEPLTNGVSRHYFDLVVRELSRTKKFLRHLEQERGIKLGEEWTAVQTVQRCKKLERENACLQNDLKDLKSHFQDTSDQTNVKMIFALQEKVASLERGREQREEKLAQMQNQLTVFKNLCQVLVIRQQAAMPQAGRFPANPSEVFRDASTSTEKEEEDDQVFSDTPIAKESPPPNSLGGSKDSGVNLSSTVSMSHQLVQTDPPGSLLVERASSLASSGVQTEDSLQEDMAALEQQVENLSAVNKDLVARNETVRRLYQGSLESLRQVLDGRKVQTLEQQIRSLQQTVLTQQKQSQDAQATIQQLSYQVDSLQGLHGSEVKQRQELDQLLAREKARVVQQEKVFMEKIRLLQNQVDTLTTEKKVMVSQMLAGKVVPVQPLLQSVPLPAELQDMADKPWKKSPPAPSGPDADNSIQALKLASRMVPVKVCEDKIAAELDSPSTTAMPELVCSHCLRSDFSDDNSYLTHMQKCLD